MCEIFHSIQGEQSGLGEPSVFVRLAKCNLSCDWCDSKYALSEEYRNTDVNKVFKQIKGYDCPNIVITGGEPLIQMGPLVYLVSLLCYEGYNVTIETNGTIKPCEALLDKVNRWNVSPKFGHLHYGVLKSFKALSGTVFKFVIESKSQIKFIEEFQDVLDIPSHLVYLMPCARMQSSYLIEAPKIIELCKEYGYNFSPREHIVLWDAKRGV